MFASFRSGTTIINQRYSLAHKSEKVYNLSVLLNSKLWRQDVLHGSASRGKIFHFAGSGDRRILELWGGNLQFRDP